jgi:hypothetical protein
MNCISLWKLFIFVRYEKETYNRIIVILSVLDEF